MKKIFMSLNNDINNFELKKNYEHYTSEKKESYELYNRAVKMIENRCLISAKNLIESAYIINKDDEEIINLLVLLNLFYCNFDRAAEILYNSKIYQYNKIALKYISILTSEEFDVFLEYYNLGISKLSEGDYNKALKIFEYIRYKEIDLIEPYEIVHSIYLKNENYTKTEEYFNIIKSIDKECNISEYDTLLDKIKPQNKSKLPIVILSSIIAFMGIGLYSLVKKDNYNKLNNISQNESLNQNYLIKENENKDKDVQQDKQNDKRDENKDINKSDDIDIKKASDIKLSEGELVSKAQKYKEKKEYKDAIEMYKDIIILNKSTDMVSESTYQVAILSEKTNNLEQAIKYYKEYIDKYSVNYAYYDESYYNIAMIYYNNNKLEEAKKYLSELIIKDPQSMYNNSKLQKILEE